MNTQALQTSPDDETGRRHRFPRHGVRSRSLDDASAAAARAYRDDRAFALRVMLVADSTGTFVESPDR